VWRALQERPDDDVPRFGAAFEEFLAQYGCRGPTEWDALHSRGGRPGPPLGMIASMRLPDVEAPATGCEARRNAGRPRASGCESCWPARLGQLAQFDAALASAALCIAARERRS